MEPELVCTSTAPTNGREVMPLDQYQRHTSIVLFYKYFLPTVDANESTNVDSSAADDISCNTKAHAVAAAAVDPIALLRRYPEFYIEQLQAFCKNLCTNLSLKGRILIATEGVNGTVSADSIDTLQQFISAMSTLDIANDFGQPPNSDGGSSHGATPSISRIFDEIDWKLSSTAPGKQTGSTTASESLERQQQLQLQPFPDLKVSIVKEIISTGGLVSVDDVKDHGGTHLTPQAFHQCILDNPDVVLIDVRNTFEHAIGHFVHPTTGQSAMNPETTTFSSFDATFCAPHAEALHNKKVLMYCTGGIRCEKASVMLKQRGVADVSQLSGGIHRYLETYGETGLFRGKNFVFDQRVAQTPSECHIKSVLEDSKVHDDSEATMGEAGDKNNGPITTGSADAPADTNLSSVVVGQCIECHASFDELCGSRICTVCRDLVLVCPQCRLVLREYHCQRHQAFKRCYFTFLEAFTLVELQEHARDLAHLRDSLFQPAAQHRNVRRTIARQLERVNARLHDLETGRVAAIVDRSKCPRRCRTCMETTDICDGRCWGFWKTAQWNEQQLRRRLQEGGDGDVATVEIGALEAIAIGDAVEPGPDWNELRLGSRFVKCTSTNSLSADEQGQQLLRGTVQEIKTWGAGGVELDCVAVSWVIVTTSTTTCTTGTPVPSTLDLQIYRWGVVALNGKRMYDLRKVVTS